MSSRLHDPDHPYHAHVYYGPGEREAAMVLRRRFLEIGETRADLPILFVGAATDRPVGPHPLPQYEIHFPRRTLEAVRRMILDSGLRALIHPLTDDDLADHTSLALWIGPPLPLDTSVLDPPGDNQAIARYGCADF